MKRIGSMVAVLLAAALVLSFSLPVFAAGTLKEDDAKAMFTILNKERKSAGKPTLSWNDDLAQAAQVRAIELCEQYNTDHSRPNGTSYFSVSTMIWGENTAWGYKTATDAMKGFMKSKGHKENILRDSYTMIGVGCAVADDGTWYWVQSFGNGKSNASWAGVKEYDYDPFNDPNVKLRADGPGANAKKTGSAKLLDDAGAVQSAGLLAGLDKSIAATDKKSVSVRVKNGVSVSPAAMKAMADAALAKNRTAWIQADTMSASGKTVLGRLTLNPAKLGARKGDIRLGVSPEKTAVAATKAAVGKKYSGAAAFVHMEHQGSLTTRTKVGAKVDLTGLDTEKLRFYLYDAKKDTLTAIENPDYSISKAGFLSFYTKTGGEIVITDKAVG